MKKYRFFPVSLQNKLYTAIIFSTILWITAVAILLYTLTERYEIQAGLQKEQLLLHGMESRLTNFQTLLDNSVNDILQSEIFPAFFTINPLQMRNLSANPSVSSS